MFNKTLSVQELNGYIHSIFLAEDMLHDVSVFGEVSGFKVSGPHAYFTIKGEDSALPCTLFNYRRTYLPKEGDSVIAKGTPDFYRKTGKLSFQVVSLQPVGVGDLHARFEQLKEQLLKEGIFAPEHKVAIPAYPRDICVITSKTGAVIRDICRTIRNVNQTINVHIYNVRVQGEGAENEIVKGIERTDGKFDAIIIARGGGSLEDLAPFNTECLARAIYQAKTPIISAVGHETDFTICDFAADARAATPTAAAHLVAFDEEKIISEIFSLLTKMGINLQGRAESSEKELTLLLRAMSHSTELLVERGRAEWRVKANALASSARAFVRKKESLLEKALLSYGAANPLNSLKKGFFGASKGGERVTSVMQIAVGDELLLTAKDGKICTEVKEIQK